ncbi:hypothetical protein [Rhizobium ruizarguesonis]|nr:hypothetical protein [Rhizobium ruizarguesonis]
MNKPPLLARRPFPEIPISSKAKAGWLQVAIEIEREKQRTECDEN